MSRMNERYLAQRGVPRDPKQVSAWRNLLETIVWIIGAGLGGLFGVSRAGKAVERTPEDVIGLLYQYGQHVGDIDLDWSAWDTFLAVPIKDSGLDRIRLECGDLTYEVDEIFARKILALAERLEDGITG